MSLLSIRDLVVRFRTHDGTVYAVNGVSFDLDEGETLGLVGESGCGKSVTNLAVMRLLPKPAGRIEGGKVDLRRPGPARLDESEMRDIRGKEIAMIFQDPMTSLNPVLTIEEQMVETIRAHRRVIQVRGPKARAIELLAMVGIPQPEARLRNYPHQFSGGMRQRVMIAMALALEPKLLIADEPTTALDVTIQAQVLELLSRLAADHGTAVILITHDLGVVAGMTRASTSCTPATSSRAPTPGPVRSAVATPTRRPAALHAAPGRPAGRAADPDRRRAARSAVRPGGLPVRAALRLAPGPVLDRDAGLEPIDPGREIVTTGPAGHAPGGLLESAHAGGSGRRPAAAPRLRPAPPPEEVRSMSDGPHADARGRRRFRHGRPRPGPAAHARSSSQGPAHVLPDHAAASWSAVTSATSVPWTASRSRSRRARRSAWSGSRAAARAPSAGRSCGCTARRPAASSSTARTSPPPRARASGRPAANADDLPGPVRQPEPAHDRRRDRLRAARDPRRRREEERRERVRDLLATVGLDPDYGDRYPHEFSGGQRQRIGVARALALHPT
jgi:ABC-type dipeptide/oligopeptide/nickel transport system ATPase component